MWNDPIVQEIHEFRQKHAQKFNFDLRAIYDDIKQQEKKSGIRTVSLQVKRLQVNKTNS